MKFFPELRVYDAELGLAGTIDLCIQLPDGRIVLIDWKTNKAIWEKGFHENTNPITGHLDDCNYVHYTLQLSTYAHIIERMFGVKVAHLLLVHLTDGGWKEHRVVYEKETVKNMLAHVNG